MARTASSIHEFKRGLRVRVCGPVGTVVQRGEEGTVDRDPYEASSVYVELDKGGRIRLMIPEEVETVSRGPREVGTRVRPLVNFRCPFSLMIPEEVETVSLGPWEVGTRVRSLVNFGRCQEGDEGLTANLPEKELFVAIRFDSHKVGQALWTPSAWEAVERLEILEPEKKAAAAVSTSSPDACGAATKPKRKRWGDGLDAPAAGAREYFPNGWSPARDVYEAIQVFGHSNAAIELIRGKGEKLQRELAMLDLVIPPEYTSVVFSYTQEDEEYDLYGKLNAACRASGGLAEKKIALYRDFMYHLQEALTTLPTFYGRVFRGIDCTVSPVRYATGKRITWQGFASASKLQQEARKFLSVHRGQLGGSLFILDIKNGKEVDSVSAFPEEQEVLLKPNTFFNVVEKLEGEVAKKGALADLAGYGMEDLEVYVLKQV